MLTYKEDYVFLSVLEPMEDTCNLTLWLLLCHVPAGRERQVDYRQVRKNTIVNLL